MAENMVTTEEVLGKEGLIPLLAIDRAIAALKPEVKLLEPEVKYEDRIMRFATRIQKFLNGGEDTPQGDISDEG